VYEKGSKKEVLHTEEETIVETAPVAEAEEEVIDLSDLPEIEEPATLIEPEEPAEPAPKKPRPRKKKPEKGAVMGDIIDLSLDDIPDDEPNLFNM
jgi:hypothetical protein